VNTRSVRFRLTLWYSLTLILAVALISLVVFLATRQALLAQTDGMLASHGGKVLEVAARQGIDMHADMGKELFLQEFAAIPGMLVYVLDDQGQMQVSSSSVQLPPEALAGLFQQAHQVNNPFFLTQQAGSLTLRFWAVPIRVAGSFQGAVLLASPMDTIQQSLASLLWTLLAVFLVLTPPAVFGGYMLARRALQPIARMSTQMRRISSANLQQRVEDPRTGDELQELAYTFNGLLDRLGQAFERERQLLGDVAHELKTPLATMRAGIEVTLDRPRKESEYQKTLRESLVDVDTMTRTLQNLLDLAWVRAEDGRSEAQRISLSSLLENRVHSLQTIAQARGISIRHSIAPGLWVQAQEDKLSRALLNVLDNAVKYTPEGGSVHVTLVGAGGSARLCVEDDGSGIPTEDLPHVFERFYRGSTSRQTLGSGLGLAITQAIVQAYHGTVGIESSAGAGTTVTVTLPLA
jgi:two-component system OmpR family sensor kinase